MKERLPLPRYTDRMNDPDPRAPHSALHTRPTLLFRLRNWEDDTSWNEFYHLYHNFVFGLARRSGLSHADAEEVTQDVFTRVAETIHNFESNPARGSFRGWLANLTRWRIKDKFRARRPDQQTPSPGPAAPPSEGTRTIEGIEDPGDSGSPWGDAAAEECEWQRQVLDAALARLARRVPARQFQVFELYKRQNWPVLRVARELRVNPATVYVISHRLTKLVRAEVALMTRQLA